MCVRATQSMKIGQKLNLREKKVEDYMKSIRGRKEKISNDKIII